MFVLYLPTVPRTYLLYSETGRHGHTNMDKGIRYKLCLETRAWIITKQTIEQIWFDLFCLGGCKSEPHRSLFTSPYRIGNRSGNISVREENRKQLGRFIVVVTQIGNNSGPNRKHIRKGDGLWQKLETLRNQIENVPDTHRNTSSGDTDQK